ncbi:hypothetical protein Tco_1049444 [Tanacetum coccineum]
MAALRYRDEHNKVGYLPKPKGSDDYHQILDFLGASHIRYALTINPIIFDSLVKQFWSTAILRSPELGPPAILATIDATPYTFTEESVRGQLQLADDGGIDDLPIVDIYSGMDNIGYVTEGKLTFYKNKFSPQWRRKFNWSSYIFKGMVRNICNAKKFLMYPRFLLTILAIETSNTTQYKVFKLSSKLFANIKLNFVGQPKPLLAAMLSQAGEGAGVVAPTVPQIILEPNPEPMPETDQPQDHLTSPSRQQTSDPIAPVFEHGQSSDPDIASFSQVQETNDAPFTPTNVDDEPLGGSYHASPPGSTQASPAGHTSGGAEDPITLTALSFVVSTLVQKVNSLETKLKAHKKLFKDVVGKLVKQVKAMEVKLKTKKRKVVVSDYDNEEGGTQDVDLDALHALANAAMTIDSTKSPGGASSDPAACSDVPTSDVPTTDVPTTDVPTHDPSGVAPTGPSIVSPGSTTVPTSSSIPAAEQIPARSGTTTATPSSPIRDAKKGKGVAVEEPTPTQAKTFKQLEEERLDASWDIILARLQANPDLSSTIFKVDVTDDEFAAKMVTLNQGPAVYSTGWTMAQVRKLSPEHFRRVIIRFQRSCYISQRAERDGANDYDLAFLKKLRLLMYEVELEVPSHGVPHEVEVEAPSQDVSREKVDAPSHSQNIQNSIELNVIPPVYFICSLLTGIYLPTGFRNRQSIYNSTTICKNSSQALGKSFTCPLEQLEDIYGARVERFIQDKKLEVSWSCSWGDLKVLMDSPEVNGARSSAGDLSRNSGNKLTTHCVSVDCLPQEDKFLTDFPSVLRVINLTLYHIKGWLESLANATDGLVTNSTSRVVFQSRCWSRFPAVFLQCCCLLMFQVQQTLMYKLPGYEDQSV